MFWSYSVHNWTITISSRFGKALGSSSYIRLYCDFFTLSIWSDLLKLPRALSPADQLKLGKNGNYRFLLDWEEERKARVGIEALLFLYLSLKIALVFFFNITASRGNCGHGGKTRLVGFHIIIKIRLMPINPVILAFLCDRIRLTLSSPHISLFFPSSLSSFFSLIASFSNDSLHFYITQDMELHGAKRMSPVRYDSPDPW